MSTSMNLRKSTPLKQVLFKSVSSEGVEDESASEEENENDSQPESENPCCRICYVEVSEENRLKHKTLKPCKCIGSVSSVHTECLQKWIESNMTFKQTGSTDCYWWRSVQCDLCQTPYSQEFLEEFSILRYDKFIY